MNVANSFLQLPALQEDRSTRLKGLDKYIKLWPAISHGPIL